MLSPAPGMVPSPSPQSVINPASVSYYAGSVPSPSSVALNTPGTVVSPSPVTTVVTPYINSTLQGHTWWGVTVPAREWN